MSYKATNWAYDLPLRGSAKAVLVALADFADEEHSCYPGQERLASMTGLSRRTVTRAVGRLEGLGLLSREHRVDSRGYRKTDRYVLNVGAEMPVDNSQSLSDNLAHGGESLSDNLSNPYVTICPSLSDTVSHSYKEEPSEEPSVIDPSDARARETDLFHIGEFREERPDLDRLSDATIRQLAAETIANAKRAVKNETRYVLKAAKDPVWVQEGDKREWDALMANRAVTA